MKNIFKRYLYLPLFCLFFMFGGILLTSCDFFQSQQDVKSITVDFYVGTERVSHRIITDTENPKTPNANCDEGYYIDGWFFDKDVWHDEFSKEAIHEYIDNEVKEVNVYARLTPINYTITYDNINGVDINNLPTNYTIETETFSIPNVSLDYYTFDGWFNGNTKIEEIPLGSIGNITLTAKFTPIGYLITYTNTKDAINPNPATYNYENGEIVLSDISKDGYNFEGWYKDDVKVTSIPANSHGEIELVAKWSLITYTITYENTLTADISNFPKSFTVESDDIVLPDNVSVICHNFTGWTLDANPINVIPTGTTKNIVLKATYTTTHNIIKDYGFDPTCTEKGLTNGSHCDICNEILEEQVDIPKLGHNYVATWTWNGYDVATLELTCKNDPTHTHVLESSIHTDTINPTCAEEGSITYTAEADFDGITYSDVKIKVIETTPHKYIPCDNDKDHHTCSMCNQLFEHVDTEYDGYCNICNVFVEEIIEIFNEFQLYDINGNMSAAYVLRSDITLPGNWAALGTKDNPFTGKLYGNGHTISSFSFTTSSDYGLFIYNYGIIDGLTLSDISIALNATGVAGGIAAYNYGTIRNCTIKGNGSVAARNEASLNGQKREYTFVMGAICGQNKGTISDCKVEGVMNTLFVTSCYSYHNGAIPPMNGSATAKSTVYFGNIAGKNDGTVSNSIVSCNTLMTIKATATNYVPADASHAEIDCYAGSLVGLNSSLITACSARACTTYDAIITADNGKYCYAKISISKPAMYEGILGKNDGRIEKFSPVA